MDKRPFSRGRCSAKKSFAPLEGPGKFGAGDVTSLRSAEGMPLPAPLERDVPGFY